MRRHCQRHYRRWGFAPHPENLHPFCKGCDSQINRSKLELQAMSIDISCVHRLLARYAEHGFQSEWVGLSN